MGSKHLPFFARHLLLIAVLFPCIASAKELAVPDAARAAINQGIKEGNIPGAVLVFGTADEVESVTAFGNKSVTPDKEPMTVDTIFDFASLTKPVATATSVMILVERGDLKLTEPVATYMPEFGNHGKEVITVEQLLRHRGGLTPDNPMSDYDAGGDAGWQAILQSTPRWEPGSRFAYSDVGFIVLGKLVEKVSGRPLDEFAKAEIFEPLGMKDTTFKPAASLRDRMAPTTERNGKPIVGEVHDPRSYALGGVAGHAGLFGTAQDLARWVRMILNGGELDGARILNESTVKLMLKGVAMPDGKNSRGLGVDVDSGYSPAPRGSRFDVGTTFGHTGYTGGAFWADPVHGVFYVLMTNRVHPDDTGKVSAVRRGVATAVASLLLGDEPHANAADQGDQTDGVLNGIDVLERDNFKLLEGRNVAIITNQTGIDRDGNSVVDLLNDAPNVNVVKLFSPEHGLYGNVDERVGNAVEPKTGLRVYSLYGETRKPSPEMLEGVDTLVFDIQDVGARFYTYISTLGLCMQAAQEQGVSMFVLDRPNPINGVDVAGPVADAKYQGFTAFGALPLRHGMTVGELAKLYNDAFGIGCDLTVVPVEGWTRDMWFDQTGLRWVNPSPNMRNLTQAEIYTGIGLLESGRQISCGRGTDQPFEMFGAPFIDGRELAAALNKRDIPGLSFVPVNFTPTERHYSGQECGGCYVMVLDREKLEPVSAGMTIAWVIEHLYPEQYDQDSVTRMIQDDAAMNALRTVDDPKDIPAVWQDELDAFKKVRAKYLMYK